LLKLLEYFQNIRSVPINAPQKNAHFVVNVSGANNSTQGPH